MADVPPASPINSDIWICDFYNLYDPRFLAESGINAVVSLLDDWAPLFNRPDFTDHIDSKRHLFIKCSDTKTQDLLAHFAQICDFIDRMITGNDSGANRFAGLSKGVVLVHCEEGISRSPTVVIAYLMKKSGKGLNQVLDQVRKKRPIVDPSENFLAQLKQWEDIYHEQATRTLQPKP